MRLRGAHRPRGAHNGLHASLAGGTLHPPAPAVCLLNGLPSLSHSGVKGRCALMSARWAFGPPLTPPRPGWAGDTGRPGRARSSARPAGSTRRDGMRQFEQHWLELGSRVARSLHYQAPR